MLAFTKSKLTWPVDKSDDSVPGNPPSNIELSTKIKKSISQLIESILKSRSTEARMSVFQIDNIHTLFQYKMIHIERVQEFHSYPYKDRFLR